MSTVAAALSVQPERAPRGRLDGRVLLVTFDRFRQASRVFGVYSTPGQPVPVSQGSDLLELDTLAMVGDAWAFLRDPLSASGIGMAQGLADLDPDELTGVPGVDHLLVWRRIRDEATSGRWRRVIVDCSGGADPFTFLGVAASVAGYLERVWPRHRRLAGAADGPGTPGGAAVVDGLAADCADIADLLVDPDVVHAHLVAPPGPHGWEMAQRHLAVLDLMGIDTQSVVWNAGTSGPTRTAPDDPPKRLSDNRSGDLVEVVAPALPTAPRTVAALRKLGVRSSDRPGQAVGSRAPEVEHVSGSGLTALYRMSWRQPLPDPKTLALGRSGDELLVTLSGWRERVPLPSVLRRCSVVDARWEDGVVSVRFRPDPRVWPKKGDGDA